MAWSIFRETLRREWRATLIWGGVMAFFGFVTIIVLPDSEGMQQLVEGLRAVPPFLWRLLGVEDLTVLATPAGFIGLRYFLTAAVIISAWAVLAGLNVTVNDEARGVATMLVSLPLPRWRMIVEKVLAYVPLALLVPLAGLGGLMLGIAANPNAQTDLGPLLAASVTLTPIAILLIGLTALVGAAIPSRAIAGAVGGGFVAVSFLLKSVAGLARSELGDTMAQLSIFQHADGLTVIRRGFAPATALLMLALAAVLVVLAAAFFQRRDLSA